MRKLKRFVALLLVLLLSFSLTGCMGRALGFSAARVIIELIRPEPADSRVETVSLEGLWGGQWELFFAEGKYASREGKRLNCCAEFDGNGNVLIWDDDTSKSQYLARLSYEARDGEYHITGGEFLDKKDGFDKWTLRLLQRDSGPELVLRGNYKSESMGSFSFAMYFEE